MYFELDLTGFESEITRLKLTERRVALIHKRVKSAVVSFLQKHYKNLDKERANSLGGTRTHYWQKAGQSIVTEDVSDGFILSVNHVGVRLHLFGGRVEPGVNISWATGKPTKMLAIPKDAEAYGKTTADFAGELETLWTRKGGEPRPWALAYPLSAKSAKTTREQGDKRKGKIGVAVVKGKEGAEARRIMFILVKSATIKADPTTFPSEQEIEDVAVSAVERFIGATNKEVADETKADEETSLEKFLRTDELPSESSGEGEESE